MGLFDFAKRQCVDVIEWSDSSQNTMVHRYEMYDKEIMMGAQLTVRESQAAIFVNEGQLADVFVPGRYTLSTQNMPIMTMLKSWSFGFNSPFKSDVYFVNTKQFLDCKWGTTNPVMMRDRELGMIRVRAFGSFSFRVKDPVMFMREVFGTTARYTVESIQGQIKSLVVSGLSDGIAESGISALDLAANYTELGQVVLNELNPKVESLGLTLVNFVIENISLPQEVEKAIDSRTSIGVVGNLNQYSQYQAAQSMRDAANNPSGFGMAAMGVSMMPQMFPQNQMQQQPQQQQAPVQQSASAYCSSCGKPLSQGSKFCAECGASQQVASNACAGCGMEMQPGVKFCSNCGKARG